MIGLIGSRLNLINFDEREDIVKEFNLNESQIPIRIEFNPSKAEIIVCTRKELKFYDLNTGRCKFSTRGMMLDELDEIVAFKLISQG